jgi:replicative DNA helicase
MQSQLITSAIAAEAGVLGSMILDRNTVDVVRRILSPEDFGKIEHRLIAECVYALSQNTTKEIDCVLIRDFLNGRGQLDTIGGVEYLQKLMETLPTSANAEYYARIVKDHAERREIVRISQDAISKCLKPDGLDAEKIRCGAIEGFAGVNKGGGSMLSMQEVFDDIDFATERVAVTTGFPAVDGAMAGYGAGQYITVAGRPGMGKSAFMAASAVWAAVHDKHVLFFSMEMPAKDIVTRMACAEERVNVFEAFRGGRWLNDLQKDRLELARKKMQRLPIQYDCGSLTPARLRSEIQAAVRQGKADIAFVDYIGLMRPNNPKTVGRYEMVSDISNALKQIALDCNIPLVVGCQLNREVAKVGDKRPMLQHLRDSGAIEQDSDVVLFLHRPAYYLTPEERQQELDLGRLDEDLCELIIAKNRNGGTGIIRLNFEGQYTRFEELNS